MLQAPKSVTAVKILDFVFTAGSSPCKILADDGEIYFAKTTEPSNPPFVELINEVVGSYFGKLWNLHTPIPAVVTIPDQHLEEYQTSTDKKIPDRYKKISIGSRPFFGSQLVGNQIELESYIGGLGSKHEYNHFEDPLDLVRIGIFDSWLCNKDRKPENPNVLISQAGSLLRLHPIDHTASFGYVSELKSLKEIDMYLEEKKCLLSTRLSTSILKFAPRQKIRSLSSEMESAMNACIASADEVFSLIPAEWGFSKKAKQKVTEVLSLPERNKRLAESALRFVPTQ